MNINEWSLDKLFMWAGTAVLVVLLMPLGFYFTHEIVTSSENSLIERGKSLSKDLAGHIVTPMLLKDYLTLHEALKRTLSADSAVRYVCIENSSGEVVGHTFEKKCSLELKELWRKNRGQILHFSTEVEPLIDIPAKILTGQLGTLHIGMSRTEAIASMSRMMWVMGLALAGAFSVVLIGTHFIAKKVSAPLRHLEAAVSRYPEKTCKKNGLEVSGTKEVKSLAKGFADMTKRLALLEREREETQKRMIEAERLAAMGELAAGLAHEVNNPLGGMQRCLNFLEEDPHKSLRASKYYPLLTTGLKRIGRAMQDMLAFARSGQDVILESCELKAIIDSLRLLVQAHLKGRNVKITWENPNGCICLCDTDCVAQAALNLILNAVEAAEESTKPAVFIKATCDSDWTYLTVEDSGPGVSDLLKERIFEPFYSTKAIGKGTGLGLSVSRQLIRSIGGEIELSPEPGSLGGARFVVRLLKTSCLECNND